MKALVFLLVTFLSLISVGVNAAPLTYLFGGKVTLIRPRSVKGKNRP